MSETQAEAAVPEWDLADRMRKALRTSDTGVQEMADYLGVARNTVSNWINGRIQPSTQTLRLWALRCGVPYEWLLGEGVRTAPIRFARRSWCSDCGDLICPGCGGCGSLRHPCTCDVYGTSSVHRSGLGLAA